jgi:phosphoglycolate phosphatase-like HAD superfamily hydrolase
MGVKKVLVVDVDETLLSLEPLFFLKKFKKDYEEYGGKTIFGRYYISARPNAELFLKMAKEKYDLAAFSVVGKDITEQKLKAVNLFSYFSKIYGKESLVEGKKNPNLIAEDMNVNPDEIMIIDDKPGQVIGEAIEISPWFIGNNKEDEELIKVFEQKLKPKVEIIP